jgi:hypothetical protein
MNKEFACPSCGANIIISSWEALGSRASGPAKFVCTKCKSILMLPMSWRIAMVATIIATIFGGLFLMNFIRHPNRDTEVYMGLAVLAVAAVWLAGVVGLFAPRLVVRRPRA